MPRWARVSQPTRRVRAEAGGLAISALPPPGEGQLQPASDQRAELQLPLAQLVPVQRPEGKLRLVQRPEATAPLAHGTPRMPRPRPSKATGHVCTQFGLKWATSASARSTSWAPPAMALALSVMAPLM